MKSMLCVLMGFIFYSARGQEQFQLERPLAKELKEISGTVKDGDVLWAITDARGSIYKLDLKGNVIQELKLENVRLTDVEAVAADSKYLYVGDIGDNKGIRNDRVVVRILKSSIDRSATSIGGEQIRFSFPDAASASNQKANNLDCEAMISYGDSLYLFTKRDDMRTGVYALSKTPGTHVARHKGEFKTKGLITDASVNLRGNEISLVGYDNGHRRPFVWVLSDFTGDNFFSGKQERFELTHKKNLDWQVEGISYRDEASYFISCEKTRDVPNTLYVIQKAGLLNEGKAD
ncbi:MAG TPA: hypothetical protein VNR87_07585 [Flavisolibacter sp.]|nr:hypothetical protein [Flavisolibacter sp.]